MTKTLSAKDRSIIIQSLRSGLVPRSGLQHIQVGRVNEVKSFVSDIENIASGGTAFRFVIGEYGSGKTFFLSLVRSIALEKGLIAVRADLSATKRLHGTSGQARILLSELVSSMSTRTKQDGNALTIIMDRLMSRAADYAEQKDTDTQSAVRCLLSDMMEYTGGHTFREVVMLYCQACEHGNDVQKNYALKWLMGGYSTKTEAARDLGVRENITDAAFFSTIKLYSVLVRKAGYKGLLVCLDELANLYKISNTVSRKANYEEILTMLNDTLQGNTPAIGFIMGGTPDFLTDSYRGLYSYEALRSRLAENSFAEKTGLIDYNSTVLRLSNLTKEEMYVLLKNLRNVFALGKSENYLVPNEALIAYLNHCANIVGDCYFRTPRNTIKGFLDMLSLLEQYPEKKWDEIINNIEIKEDIEESGVHHLLGSSNDALDDDNQFAVFKI